MKFSPKFLLIISGPTASGKTALAVRMAKHFETVILSADSRQFYKELPIGTAAPEQNYLQEVKHYFVGHLSVSDSYNVSKFENDALHLLKNLWKKHDIVIMVGGSGLYINAVCNGIDELPDPDEKLRRQLEEDFQLKGIKALQAQLEDLDPEYYRQVDLKNPKRLMRALEVCLQTGKKYSDLRRNRPQLRDFQCIKIGLDLPREELFERINRRTDIMLKTGWIEEAKAVFPSRHLNALNTVGYKELFAWLEGQTTFEFAVEKIKTNSRRYAKRQMTWFRKDKEIHWFHPSNTEGIVRFVEMNL